jgi:hypothetical protein
MIGTIKKASKLQLNTKRPCANYTGLEKSRFACFSDDTKTPLASLLERAPFARSLAAQPPNELALAKGVPNSFYLTKRLMK